MGRPTKYKPEYPETIVKWFEGQVENKELPFLSKWARTVAGVSEQTALTWTEKEPEFLESYKKVKEIQKEFLIKGGLTGLFNPTFAIFTAKNITDMRDKQEMSHTGTLNHTLDVSDDLYRTIIKREAERIKVGSN